MSTIVYVELTIITVVLTVYFIITSILSVEIIKAVKAFNKLTVKAESLIESAQSAAESIHKWGSRSSRGMPFLNFLSRVFDKDKPNKE